MALDNIVNVVIDKQDAALTQQGFGTLLLAGYHTVWVGPEVTRTYPGQGGLEAMVTDGFTVNDALYKLASAVLSNNPRLPEFKIGKLATPPVFTAEITPVNTTVGFKYDFDVIDESGVTTNITYTVQAADTVALIVDQFVSQIGAISGISCADNATYATVTTDGTGKIAAIVSKHGYADLRVANVTADPGVAADLSIIEAADPVWYGGLLASNSPAEVAAAAAWAEARTKLFGFSVSDTECKSAAVTDDILSTLQDAAYFRNFALFTENDLQYGAARLMGEEFPFQPGSRTWEFKTLSGLTVSELTASEISAIKAKNGLYYVAEAGTNRTYNSKTPGGEWIDIVHGIDELKARVQEGVFGVLVANGKVPYTDAGVTMIVTPIQGVLDARIDTKFLSPDPAPFAYGPKVSTVSTANRAARLLPDVRFSGRVAGAIHAVNINGELSV